MRFKSLFVMLLAGANANVLAQEFALSTVVGGLERPVALAVAPDGRIFVSEQGGKLRIVENGLLLEQPFLELDVLDDGESGLIGVALDPEFSQNGYVYVFVTVDETEQQIIRYTDNNNQASAATVIRSGLPTNGRFHNGGAIAFGPDGKLFFTVGDTGEPSASQSLNTLAGKVCRINADGTVPNDNPFTTPTGAPSAIFALGFRNPFRMTIAPDGRVFVADVGSSGDQRREELNIVYAGENYGWPEVEGFGTSQQAEQFRDPVFAYSELGQAATGVVFYTGTAFPTRFHNNLFQLEWVLNRLFRLVLDGDALVSDELILEIEGGPVELIQDLDGSLLVTQYFSGTVGRVTYIGEPDDPNNPETGPDTDLLPTTPALPCGLPLLLGLTLACIGYRR